MFFPPPPRPEPAEPAGPDSQEVAVTAHALKLMSDGLELEAVPARLMSDLGVDAETAASCVLGIRALQMEAEVRVKQIEAEQDEGGLALAGTIGSVIGALLFGGIRLWMLESGTSSSGGFIKSAVLGAMLGGLAGCWIARNLGDKADTR
jgi:hypothetical protein